MHMLNSILASTMGGGNFVLEMATTGLPSLFFRLKLLLLHCIIMPSVPSVPSMPMLVSIPSLLGLLALHSVRKEGEKDLYCLH